MGSPSIPRDLFNEGGEVFDAELETLLEIFERLDNDDRMIYGDKSSEFIATHTALLGDQLNLLGIVL